MMRGTHLIFAILIWIILLILLSAGSVTLGAALLLIIAGAG